MERWTPISPPSDGISSDINGSIRAILVQPDGRIVIGGCSPPSTAAMSIISRRLNNDGTTDTNFNVGWDAIQRRGPGLSIPKLPHRRGRFRYPDQWLTRKWRDATQPRRLPWIQALTLALGANGFVDSIAVQTNDEIDLAGQFSTFNNLSENNFVRLFGGANAGNGSIQFSDQVYGVLESEQPMATHLVPTHRAGHLRLSVSQRGIFDPPTEQPCNGKGINIGVTNTINLPAG